jgi:PEP-CTERM motif
MFRHLVSSAALLGALLFTGLARADINSEPFTDPGYVAGNALSDFYWDSGDDTTGALDIEDVGGIHGRVTKLTANGPDPGSSFQSLTAIADGWGGPGRDGGVAGPLWFTVDIEKGSGDGNTSLTDAIWSLSFVRQNGLNNIAILDGGLGTFRLRAGQGNANPTVDTAFFNLHDGWNQVGVLNDNSANPNTILYLDGVQVAAVNTSSGPTTSDSTSTYRVTLQRQGGGGTGNNFVGTMRFDNITTANENILVPEPSTGLLFCVGLAGLVAAARKRIGR